MPEPQLTLPDPVFIITKVAMTMGTHAVANFNELIQSDVIDQISKVVAASINLPKLQLPIPKIPMLEWG